MKKNESSIRLFANYAINIISSVLNSSPFPPLNNDFDWSGFADFCSEHKIINIVAFGLQNSDVSVPESISSLFNDSLLHSMLKEAQRDVEIELLTEDFENNKIPHMIMKGYVIKDLYPQPFMRTMGDVDILVGNNLSDASEEILRHGFKLKGEAFLHDVFIKDNSLAVELHKSLIDESLEKFYKYFGIGFDRAHLCGNCNYRYELSVEDFYIFLIAHMAKHYEICGTGIRSVCDIFVYNKHYGNTINREYIASELDKTGLRVFEEKIRKLSYEWFSGGFSGNFDAVGEYLISDGVFGNIDNHELNAYLLSDNQKKSKLSYYLSCIFPDFSYMCARYPKLKKAPVLLPFYWIRRIISTLFKSKGSIRYRLKGVMTSDKNDSDRFNETGLNN